MAESPEKISDSTAESFSPPPNSQNLTPTNQFQLQSSPTYLYHAQPASSPKIKLALISLVLGIMSFPLVNFLIAAILAFLLAFLLGTTGAVLGFIITLAILPTGLLTGITALVKNKRYPGEYGGKGLAIAGVVLSGLGILFIPLIAVIAVPNLLAARRAANEGSAVSSLRTLAAAQESYRESKNTYICGDLNDLAQSNLIDSVLAGGTKSGYVFMIAKLPQGCEIFATPSSVNGVSATGIRSFYYSTEDNIIRAGNKGGQLANKIDLPLNSDYSTSEPASRTKVASQK